jgi:hypothetical protein
VLASFGSAGFVPWAWREKVFAAEKNGTGKIGRKKGRGKWKGPTERGPHNLGHSPECESSVEARASIMLE